VDDPVDLLPVLLGNLYTSPGEDFFHLVMPEITRQYTYLYQENSEILF
jgi:hypothetical protein